MSIVVRPADLETDALAIVDGAKDFVSRMDFANLLPATDEGIAEETARIVTLPGVDVIVADDDGDIVGAIGVLYSPFLWNSALTAAEELFWWTREDAPASVAFGLIRGVQREMRRRGVDVAMFRAPRGREAKFGRVYKRMNLNPVETTYMGSP